MVEIKNTNFSLEQICRSGQCFRMVCIGEEKYSLVACDKYLELMQKDDKIIFDCTQEEYDSVWYQYFDMETDYGKIIESIDIEDEYLSVAAEYGQGIRILRQDLWEMIISFIVSQQNNIKRITKCINNLCEKYGEKRVCGEITYYAFPTPKALAEATIEDLNACNLGYRSRYILETSRYIYTKQMDLDALYDMTYADAKKELLKLCGVGTKVADCICLFALHKTDAFPIDTHIRQVLDTHYTEGFPFERYTDYSGILQQYIFFYDLLKK